MEISNWNVSNPIKTYVKVTVIHGVKNKINGNADRASIVVSGWAMLLLLQQASLESLSPLPSVIFMRKAFGCSLLMGVFMITKGLVLC